MTRGERLKLALARAGLSAEAMGRALGLTGAAIPVEVVPAPPGWPHERRVVAVVYRPWLAALLGGQR